MATVQSLGTAGSACLLHLHVPGKSLFSAAQLLRVWSEITVRWVLCLPTEILLVLRLGLVGGGPEGGGSELWEVNCSLFLQETIMSHSIMAIWH